jgi:hypothetical protein
VYDYGFTVSCALHNIVIMSVTGNQTRDKRPSIPSSRLTANSNVAKPLLLSHRKSIAHAQAQRARAAKEAEEAETEHSITNLTGLDSSSLLATRPTPSVAYPASSQPGSVPPTTAPPSESGDELKGQLITAGKKKQKWHDTTGENSGI